MDSPLQPSLSFSESTSGRKKEAKEEVVCSWEREKRRYEQK
jgi:hypothetical protein